MASEREYVAESSSDSAEQIAAALGAELETPAVVATPETAASVPATTDASAAAAAASAAQPTEDAAAASAAEPAEIVEDEEPEPETLEVSHDAAAETPEPKKDRRSASQKRFDELTRKNHEAAARAATAEAERDGLKKRLEEVTAAKPGDAAKPAAAPAPVTADIDAATKKSLDDERAALGPKPKQDDFEDYQEFEDKKDAWVAATATINAQERIERKLAAQRVADGAQEATRAFTKAATTYQGRVTAAKAKHADYDAVIAAAAPEVTPTPQLEMLLLDEGFEEAGEMAYYLAKNVAETKRILALAPGPQLVELGAVKAIVRGQVRSAAAPKPRTTSAPEPMTSVPGSAPAATVVDDDSKLSYRDYAKKHNAREFGQRRA